MISNFSFFFFLVNVLKTNMHVMVVKFTKLIWFKHDFYTIMSLEQATTNCHEVVTRFLKYFTISQIVSGNASLSFNWNLR